MKANKSVFWNQRRVVCLLAILLPILVLVSLGIGRYHVPLESVIRVLINQFIPLEHTWTGQMEMVILKIRLPRVLLACLVGCSLSAAGAAYQGVFQNPIAAPDLLGATSGAAFGAALAILFGGSYTTISLAAFALSLIAVSLVYLIGRVAPGNRVLNLVLAGMMVGSLFSAGTSFIKLVADPTDQLPAITYWLMGSFSGASNQTVAYICLPMLTGLLILFLLRWRLNLLTVGDEAARSMGIHTNRLRLVIILAATLITAASVSVSGMIGWVGLVIPHLCRKLVGSNYVYLLPASMFVGAGFMLIIDTLSRNLLAVEIPVGILTAFIGAPFFTYLIFRKEAINE